MRYTLRRISVYTSSHSQSQPCDTLRGTRKEACRLSGVTCGICHGTLHRLHATRVRRDHDSRRAVRVAQTDWRCALNERLRPKAALAHQDARRSRPLSACDAGGRALSHPLGPSPTEVLMFNLRLWSLCGSGSAAKVADLTKVAVCDTDASLRQRASASQDSQKSSGTTCATTTPIFVIVPRRAGSKSVYS